MNVRILVLTMWMAGTLAAQTFIQMSDPQFGKYTKNANFEHDTVNFEFAIANANRLKPMFVVITGDLINDAKSAAQATEYERISAKLDPKIRLYSVAGNHDDEHE
jgi:DNA repair exonuclease SbcCD nuclease subunit